MADKDTQGESSVDPEFSVRDDVVRTPEDAAGDYAKSEAAEDGGEGNPTAKDEVTQEGEKTQEEHSPSPPPHTHSPPPHTSSPLPENFTPSPLVPEDAVAHPQSSEPEEGNSTHPPRSFTPPHSVTPPRSVTPPLSVTLSHSFAPTSRGTPPPVPTEEETAAPSRQSVTPPPSAAEEDAVSPTPADSELADRSLETEATDSVGNQDEDSLNAEAVSPTQSPSLSLSPLRSPTPDNEEAAAMADTEVQQQHHLQQQVQQEPAQQQPPEDAVCKYRWEKILQTTSQRIIFFSSAHPKDPVFLHWNEESTAYFSDEKHVPCGDYAGHVIVEGRTYPVEKFAVRSYTFEIDLFIKDDVIEDEVATSNSLAQEIKFRQQQQYQQDSVDTYKDISSAALSPHPKMEENGVVDENGIRPNSKYEELLRQQLQHKESLDASLENELVMSQKSDHSLNGSGSKRLTPVGDVDKATFQDGYSSLPVGGGAGFDVDNMGRSSTRRSGSASDFDFERCSVKSELGSSRHSLVDTPMGGGDLSSLPKSPSRAGSDHSTGFGSGRRIPQREFYGDDSLGDVRQSPVRSAEGSARQSPFAGRPGSGSRSRTPVDTRIDDVLGSPGSRSSPVRQTPTREPISDVLGSDAIIASPSRSQASGSARQTPDRDTSVAGSAHSSARGTPQKETLSTSLRSSQERLYGNQDLFPPTGDRSQVGSVSSTRHSSRAQSLSSLTSEQELSQFLDPNSSRNSGDSSRTPLNFDTHPDESATLPPIMRERDRPASLPVYTTQSPAGMDKRTYTPDHKTWGTQVTTGGGGDLGMSRDLAGKLVPRSASSSRASSRTVTPVNISVQESQKVRELEDTIATLRKLLGSREHEVHELTTQLRDLKDINQSLKRDLEHARSRRTPTGPEELERQYQQLLKEKEILAAEVVKLRDRLEITRGSKVDSSSPSSSTSQQRRIDELEAHIRDLREASDTMCQKLTRSELRIKELLDENDRLRSTTSLRVQDLHDDKGGRHGDRQHMIEIQQLKEDVRTLRDRNYMLQDENLKLKEGREPMRSSDVRANVLKDPYSERTRLTSSKSSDDGILQRMPVEPSSLRDMNPRSLDHVTSQSRSQALVSPRQNGARRSLDRSYGSDSFPLPASRDLQQRFSADRDTRDGKDSYSRSRLENAVVDKERSPASDRLLKYREFSGELGSELRRTDTGRYDVLRSRPDGEVSEKLLTTDAARYGTLSSEHLKSFDRERERERGDTKVSMSAERLRILEEAERDRERRALIGSSSVGHMTYPATNPVISQDSGRTRRSEDNKNSDDSDSTAILMSYDIKADTLPNPRDRERSTYSERSKWQRPYTDQPYLKDVDREMEKDRDFRDLRGRVYKETNGDDSDTATDILLSAEPGTSGKPSRRRQRRSSGSDASLSSLSDADDPPESLRRRSQSADAKGKRGNPSRYGQTTSLRPAASAERLSGGKTVTLSSGFRSVTPQPLATQHNRSAIIQQMQAQQASLASSLTQGLRPFAPRSPADVRSDDVVKFSRQGGKLSQGIVKFVGHLPGRTDVYLGVELYKEEGKHDGTFEGIRYFKCKPNKGVFVAFNKVVMAWAPS